MRTKVVLDRELRTSYHLSAIPLSGDGENIKVRFRWAKPKFSWCDFGEGPLMDDPKYLYLPSKTYGLNFNYWNELDLTVYK